MAGIGHFILIIKAILTRIIFATHGFVAIWRVTSIKDDPYYWYLCGSILALAFEGIFTLTIKENQEWKWFCPSVFLYLCGVVPAIWLIEVDKFDRKLALKLQAEQNLTKPVMNTTEELPPIDTFGVELQIPVQLDGETWAMVIEQLLMLILIIGRWLLPKGELTRDQLSQLLLVYIGTAADIIEFFDTFKDEKISAQRVLCLLILSIWSWSLLQFTFVLTATKSKNVRMRVTSDVEAPMPKFVNGMYKVKEVCCSIDVWGILINIILQDAPFLIFRALLIFYYKIINYMNIFFTAKNTLVIILQFYRLYIVQQEKHKEISKHEAKLASKPERAMPIGPPNVNYKNKRNRSSIRNEKRTAGTPASSSSKNKMQSKKTKSFDKDSMTSQNTRILESTRREESVQGRRKKSLSTGNLPEEFEDTIEADKFYEDDLEMGMSASGLSGTNDQDSQEESELPLDDVSVTSERLKNNRKIKMKDTRGVYKISGSRSSGASRIYSTSSRDTVNSSQRGRLVNGGSRTGRVSGKRRLHMQSPRELYSLEDEGIGISEGPSEDLENERIFQRRTAIGVVFSLFLVIFILCMVAIYGGINPKGLLLRETFVLMNSTKPKTTIMTTTTLKPTFRRKPKPQKIPVRTTITTTTDRSIPPITLLNSKVYTTTTLSIDATAYPVNENGTTMKISNSSSQPYLVQNASSELNYKMNTVSSTVIVPNAIIGAPKATTIQPDSNRLVAFRHASKHHFKLKL